jgi:hypothetical protein
MLTLFGFCIVKSNKVRFINLKGVHVYEKNAIGHSGYSNGHGRL